MVSRPQEVSTDAEEILHDPVNRREPLELSGRLETPHLALPLTRRLVGDLGSIVRVMIGNGDHRRDRVGGRVTPPVRPHHRAYGSVHGGSSAPLQIPELSQKVQESPHRL